MLPYNNKNVQLLNGTQKVIKYESLVFHLYVQGES
jgi:hypothetical protein